MIIAAIVIAVTDGAARSNHAVFITGYSLYPPNQKKMKKTFAPHATQARSC